MMLQLGETPKTNSKDPRFITSCARWPLIPVSDVGKNVSYLNVARLKLPPRRKRASPVNSFKSAGKSADDNPKTVRRSCVGASQ